MSNGDSSSSPTPQLSVQMVRDLTRRLYGLNVLTSRKLDGYDDRNFHITVDEEDVQNPYLGELCPHGYVLKILNYNDSKKPAIVKARNDIILYVHARGIPTPRPLPNTDGQLFSLEALITAEELSKSDKKLEGRNPRLYAVRLFEFLPGSTLDSVQLTPSLAFQTGRCAALLDKALEEYDDSQCPPLDMNWNMWNVPSLRNLLHVIKDAEMRTVIADVINSFETEVLGRGDRFKTGIIHNDVNAHNILVQPAVQNNPSFASSSSSPSSSASSLPMEVYAVLDFGDATKSYVFFEVAVAMTHLMVICPPSAFDPDPDEMAGHTLAGYLSEVELNPLEIQLLPITVCARMCQSLVYGLHALTLDPSNEYPVVHCKDTWIHLQRLWTRRRDVTVDIWRSVAEKLAVRFPRQFENAT